MLASLDEILANALALPDDSKLLLVERLLESIAEPDPADADLMAEVSRRCAEARADPSRLLDGDEVRREIRALVAAHTPPP